MRQKPYIDVVIPLGRGSRHGDAELRYCLRSIAKHLDGLGRVWIVGERPAWLPVDGETLIHLAVPDVCPIADVAILHKLAAACLAAPDGPRLADRFAFFSDDQVLLRPVGWRQLGPFHFGDLAHLTRWEGGWWQRMRHTRDWLAARGRGTLHGDTHAPLPMLRDELLRVCRETEWRMAPGLCVGTLYLNWTGARARPIGERKATISAKLPVAEIRRRVAGRWFLCHTDDGFTPDLRALLDELFPDKCHWEKGGKVLSRVPCQPPPVAPPPIGPGVDPRAAEKIAAFRQSIGPYPTDHFTGRGIVTCAGGPLYQANAYVLFRLLRHLGCELPIECWYDGQSESDPAWEKLVESLGVRCVDARPFGFDGHPFAPPTKYRGGKTYSEAQIRGYSLKPLAALRSAFAEVLFLDADNCPQRDPTFLFDCPEYTRAGNLFWPDRGNTPNLAGFGLQQFETNGTETGQFILDKRRMWEVAVLAEWFCRHPHYFFQHSWGDKDVHFAAALVCGTPVTECPPAIRTNATATMQHAPDGSLLFMHRTAPLAKWPVAGEPVRLAGDAWHAECCVWLDEWRQWRARSPNPISLAMVVCDEEARLPAMLADTRPYVDEVILVVQESRDRTLAIARELADTVIEHPCHGHCSPSTPELWERCTGEWVLRLDADERLSDYAKANIRAWVADSAADFYMLREVTIIDGVAIDDSLHARLCRRSKGIPGVQLHNEVEPVPDAKVVTLADEVAIEHRKTGAEQEADNERYYKLGANHVVPQDATA